MSQSRVPRTPAKRVPYKPPRDRRELVVAISVAVVIVVVTAALVWFLRPNRESASDSSPVPTVVTTPTGSTAPGDTTTTAPTGDTSPTESTAPTETTTP